MPGGQVAFQYTDLAGNPSMDIAFNPNGSMCAIEGITSPDGRVLGKMGHTERWSPYVARNIYGEKYGEYQFALADHIKEGNARYRKIETVIPGRKKI